MDQTYFTDQEYRLVLQALHRERMVCEKVDEESKCKESEHVLSSLMDSIEGKIRHIQYCYHDTDLMADGNSSKAQKEVIVAIDQNGLDAEAYVHVLNAEKGTDIEVAARLAAEAFCRTPEGRETYKENNNCFNWGDFSYIPKEVCRKYGFSPCYFTPAITVDFNEQLVSGTDSEGCGTESSEGGSL